MESNNNNLNYVTTPTDLATQDARKRRASKACVYCNRSHMSCEDARPCKRCIDRGIGHLCRDSENRKRRGRKGTYLWADLQPMPATITTPTLTPLINPSPLPPLRSPETPIVTTPTPPPHPDIDLEINSFAPELKGLFLELFFSTNNTEMNHFISMYNGETPPAKMSEDSEVEKMFTKWISVVQSRAPEELDEALRLIQTVKHRTGEYISKNFKVDPQHWENMKGLNYVKADISLLVKKYSETMEKLSVPTIMWDRGGVIYFVNSAYKRVTGFPLSLPTDRSELVMYTFVLHPGTFKDLFKSQLTLLQNYPENVEFNSFIFPASVRLHSQVGEKYIDGTMSVNYKRDFLGFPYFYIGSFLPSQAPMMHLQGPIL